VIGVTLDIYDFSTPEDKQILLQALRRSESRAGQCPFQDEGRGSLLNHRTLGYDVSYVRMTTTPTGRKIVFVTNRQISFEKLSDSHPKTST